MTSNAGAADLAKQAYGFTRTRREGDDTEAINKLFTPEFRNRLDAVISFGALPRETIYRVVDKFVMQLEAQLADRNVTIELSDPARDWLVERGLRSDNGCTPDGARHPAFDQDAAGGYPVIRQAQGWRCVRVVCRRGMKTANRSWISNSPKVRSSRARRSHPSRRNRAASGPLRRNHPGRNPVVPAAGPVPMAATRAVMAPAGCATVPKVPLVRRMSGVPQGRRIPQRRPAIRSGGNRTWMIPGPRTFRWKTRVCGIRAIRPRLRQGLQYQDPPSAGAPSQPGQQPDPGMHPQQAAPQSAPQAAPDPQARLARSAWWDLPSCL